MAEQVIQALLKSSVDMDSVFRLVDELGDVQVLQVDQDGNTKQSCIWLSHDESKKDYLNALRASGLFERTEYVDDPSSLDTSCSCSGG
jgi:hypothetical protein